ncbi:MAG: membrane protein insertion efficiency factor YidD [Sterolibacteriaceae bacterium]|nr:membrane protein insertion efficiency factor YidD [Sterolibacteriaceae bacterium]
MRRLVCTVLQGYSYLISPLLGHNCRFYPSCADYAREAVEKHGVVYGLWLASCRVGRCHPWNPGGIDPVP